MLSFRQLDDLPDTIVKIYADVEMQIINDMARRIAKAGHFTETADYQLYRLEELGTQREFIIEKLQEALDLSEQKLVELFDEAATRTLTSDDRIYRAAGYSPVPLAQNVYMQQIIAAGFKKTFGTFKNLTRTTADTATKQFEDVLDLAHQKIVTGGFSYQQAIKDGIRELSLKGIASITYPTTHTDYLDVCFRRAALTGVNQTAAEVQLRRMDELDTDLVETTAHHGARVSLYAGPENHAWWQGRWFSRSDKSSKYPDFYKETGYGTGEGLCGWNCRHSFFPVIEGLSDPAYSPEKLREYNTRKVTLDGEEVSLYEATQRQRYIERQIRRWKRESEAMEAAGLDPKQGKDKVREWQEKQRDLIKETGLRRDYFRERAGKQNLENASKDDIMNQLKSNSFRVGNIDSPKVSDAPDMLMPHTVNIPKIDGLPKVNGVVPKDAMLTNVKIIAGNGTSTPLRDIPRLNAEHGGDPRKWQKKVGTASGVYYTYEVHWYQNENLVPDEDLIVKRWKSQ